ncbi:hypothetical protein GCM10023188_49120 [Pontibacter saemangeumensis]|uniref:Lipoprotein n=1 Tax=Pontibacter saemangeumensis TaxID=1084525 RepID=A0ABP8M6Z8_9BACT
MLKRFILPLVLALVLLTSCSTPDSLKNFDSETWKDDSFACAGKRSEMVDDFEKIRKELYGKKEYVLRTVLGRPDSEELLERNQRIYYYYIEPGKQCTDRTALSEANRVEVRIGATGKISEVAYHHPYNATKPE